MIAGLQRFLFELRAAGVAASPAEWVEAVRAVEVVGVDRRRRFRQALSATLVKRASQRPVFDAVFDRFFVSPVGGGASRAGERGTGAGRPGSPGASARPSSARHSRSERTRPSLAETPSEAKSRTARQALRSRIERTRDASPERRDRLRHVLLSPVEPRTQTAPPAPAPEHTHALRRDLSARMTPEDECELAEQVPRLIERIRLRSGRRLRRAARGRLYLRRVFRENLAADGVPFVLPFRRVHPRRTRVILLVDVSWSVARAAGLFLSLAGEFVRRFRDTRVLLFVDRAVDATHVVEAWLDRGHLSRPPRHGQPGERPVRPGAGLVRDGQSFAELLTGIRTLNIDAPSDYGRAFHTMGGLGGRPTGRDTVFVVLGDGRTNRFDPQPWAFEELAARAGSVLWLIPEPVERWATGDSALDAYLPHVDVAVEARDLAGLSRGVSELLRRM